MDINIEKIKENLDKATAFTVKKAKGIMSVTKLRLKKTELKSEIADLYKEIGEMVYNSSKNEIDITERLEFIISKIDELNAEMTECNAMLDGLKEE